jgi:hypothetical protein
MDSTAERTVSGRSLITWLMALVVAMTGAALVLGPGLRERVLQEERPRTLREPIATGMYDGHPWEATGHFDGSANCVELRYRAEVLGSACDTGPEVTTSRVGADGPTVAYGIAPETATRVAVDLDNGDAVRAAVKAGDLGFPVGLWAVEVPEGAQVDQVRPLQQ